MIDMLKHTRPEGPVDVSYVTDGTEPYEFTKILVGILKEEG